MCIMMFLGYEGVGYVDSEHFRGSFRVPLTTSNPSSLQLSAFGGIIVPGGLAMRSRFFCLLIFCALVPATASAAENPLEAHVERPYGAVPYEGPIIDVHTHPKLKKVGDTYFEQARASGIVHSILMGTPNTYRKGNSQDNYPVAIRLEDVSSLCSSDFVGIAGIRKDENRARTDLYRAFEDFESGKCIGFGEVGLSHYNKPQKRPSGRKRKQHHVQLRLDHPLIVEMLAFANQHSAPVVFHIEPFYSPEKIDRLTEVMALLQTHLYSLSRGQAHCCS